MPFNPAPPNPNPPNPPQIVNQRTWAPVNQSGVAYDLTKLQSMPPSLYETDGYKEHVGDNGWEAERVYLCDWSDVAAAMQWLYGYSTLQDQGQVNAGGQGGKIIRANTYIQRVTPAQDPYRPYLYCDHVELVEGMGAWVQDPGLFVRQLGGGGAQIQRLPGMVYAEVQGLGTPDVQFSDGIAKLRAQFRQRPYIVANDKDTQGSGNGELGRYVERQVHYAIQGLSMAKLLSQLIFIEGPAGIINKSVQEGGTLLMPTASFKYVWHDVPFYPTTAIENVVGRVNADDFDGLAGWPLFPPQTLLCQAPEITWKRNICGQVAFTISWSLDYQARGWDSFPASDFQFHKATIGGGPEAADGSNLVFKTADFGQLFGVQQAALWR